MKKTKHILPVIPVISMLFICILFFAQANARGNIKSVYMQQAVTGHVTDSAGHALSGVSIQIRNSTKGVFTNEGGAFTIDAEGSDTLIISYVGYSAKEIPVNGQSNIEVMLLPQVSSLNDVVVIGYGTQQRKLVTGAISTVKASDIANQEYSRFDDALRGRTPGVMVTQSSGQPGAAPQIRIRGITSRMNSDPLYVIDGVVVTNGGLDNIDPSDIESMDVLKDASAAIYGAEASNGVIIVTTKKGKSGAPQFSYSGYYGFQNPIKHVKLANAEQYATLRNESLTNSGNAALFTDPSSYGTGTNWQDVIFKKNTPMQDHSFSISGATDKSSYFTSFGYLQQKGLVMPDISDYKRANFTINTSFKLRPWVTIGENLNYSYTKTQGIATGTEFGGPLSDALNLDPITPVVITDLSKVSNQSDYGSPYIVRNSLGQPYSISPYVQNEITNPVAYEQTVNGNYNWADNVFGNAYIEIKPIKGLTLRSSISGKEAFYGTEAFTPLFFLNGSQNNITVAKGSRSSNNNFEWTWDNTATYDYTVGLNNISAMIGTSATKSTGRDLNGEFDGLPISTFDQLSFNYSLPKEDRIAGGDEPQPHTLSSLFGRIMYNYDEKYLLSGILRRDGSSRFGSDNVYGYFPGAEAGWVISKEKFLAGSKVINFLKLRLSYGILGNEMALSDFQYAATIGSGRNYVFGQDQLNIGYSPNAPANPDLKWERTKSSDIGIDAQFLQNFTATVDFYNKNTDGMLEQVQEPYYAGYIGEPWANVGNMTNRGVEISLGYSKTKGAFQFSASGNLSYNHNNVTNLGLTPYYDEGASFQNSTYALERTQIGQPVASFYGFKELGTFKSQADIDNYKDKNGNLIQPDAKPGDFKWADIDGDGTIGPNDRTFLGNSLPTWNYGLNFTASYKHFDVLVFGQGVWGNKLFEGYRRLDLNGANYPIAALNAWTPDNANSDYPRLAESDPNHNFSNPSNFYLQNGAYFRLKTFQIGYSLPDAVAKKATLNKVRIYISANNLFTISKYTGYDPEVSGGIDKGTYPQAKTWIVGLNVTL